MKDPKIYALVKIAGELTRLNGMPPDDPSDWHFDASTTKNDIAKAIGYAKQSHNQCKSIAMEIMKVVEILRCKTCKGTGETDGALGFNGKGPCPRCQPEKTWGAYELGNDGWYRLRQ